MVPRPLPPDVAAWLADRRVMITGATGFLGRHLCALLEPTPCHLIALGSADGDLTDRAAGRALFAAHRPDHVIHLAAACGGIAANLARPADFLRDNALMGLHLIDDARQHRAGLTLVSTTCAYPQDAPMPLREDTLWHGYPAAATAPYGIAKRLLHEAITTYHRQYCFDGITLLPANLYGPGDHVDPDRSHVVAALVRRFVDAARTDAETVTCWGTGEATREFLHVTDAAYGIALATARHRDPAPVNLGTGVETSIRQLAETIAAAADYRGAIEWDSSKPTGQPRRVLDVSRARAFGFEAAVPLEEGVGEMVAWYRSRSADMRGG